MVDTNKYGEKPVTVTDPGGGYSISGVTVNAASTSVGKGSTLQFSAEVTGTGGPPQTVTWSIESSHVGATTIDGNGLLSVAAGETAANLTIRATSTVNTSKYGEKPVTVREPGSGSASITINLAGPAEDVAIVPDYDPAIPILENGIWQDGSDPVKYHQFYAQAGTFYSVNWNDSYQGDGTKTVDVRVSAYWKASNDFIFGQTDSGWNSPQTFTADRSGIVVLMVEPYYSGGTGTYAVQYTAPESTTLMLSVANAGDYSNFHWILDGTPRPETTGSITIDTSVLAPGTHRITVIAVKAGLSYSREVRFRIN
jgi:hypothetical protein